MSTVPEPIDHTMAALSVTDFAQCHASPPMKRSRSDTPPDRPPVLDLGPSAVSEPEAKKRRVRVMTVSVPAQKVLRVNLFGNTAVSESGSKTLHFTFECV